MPKTRRGREGILEAAAALFYKHGYKATGVEAIAKAAGVTKATIYHHFSNKDALIEAVLVHLSEFHKAGYINAWNKKGLKARHTYDGERPIMPWLGSITSFRITDYLRKHYSQMRHQSVDIADYENILSDVTEAHEDNESIDEILDGVPEREQKILTLMHVEGYTAKETGARLGMNESAVKVAAHRAIKKIREKIGA